MERRKNGEIDKFEYLKRARDFPENQVIHLKWFESPGEMYLEVDILVYF